MFDHIPLLAVPGPAQSPPSSAVATSAGRPSHRLVGISAPPEHPTDRPLLSGLVTVFIHCYLGSQLENNLVPNYVGNEVIFEEERTVRSCTSVEVIVNLDDLSQSMTYVLCATVITTTRSETVLCDLKGVACRD